MKYIFSCDVCRANGTIVFKETDEFKKEMISVCPFCGSDISKDDDYFDDIEELET